MIDFDIIKLSISIGIGLAVGIGLYLAVLSILSGIGNAIYRKSDALRDDSDPVGGRSNLIVYTDARTGCQYLGTTKGGFYPRLNAEGKQICDNGDK